MLLGHVWRTQPKCWATSTGVGGGEPHEAQVGQGLADFHGCSMPTFADQRQSFALGIEAQGLEDVGF